MIWKEKIIGEYIELRSIEVTDAQYIIDLRTNPRISKYIHHTSNDLETQMVFISKQRTRPNDYYFIIEGINDQQRKGSISLYNINEKPHEGEFGRWICIDDPLAALESSILLYKFGFSILGLNKIFTKTLVRNEAVIKFHKRIGSDLLINNEYDTETMQELIIQVMQKEKFFEMLAKFEELIQRMK